MPLVFMLYTGTKNPKINTTTFKTTYTEIKKHTHKDSVNKTPLKLFPQNGVGNPTTNSKQNDNRGV